MVCRIVGLPIRKRVTTRSSRGGRLEALGQAETFGDRAAGTEEYIGQGEDDEQTVMALGCVD